VALAHRSIQAGAPDREAQPGHGADRCRGAYLPCHHRRCCGAVVRGAADLDGTRAAGMVALVSSLVLVALVVFLAAAVCAAQTIWPGLPL